MQREKYNPAKNMNKSLSTPLKKAIGQIQDKIRQEFDIVLKNVGHGNTGGGLVGKFNNPFTKVHSKANKLTFSTSFEVALY